jgi:putative ABC transport system permease protein
MLQERRKPPFWYIRRRPGVVASEVDEELDVHIEMKAEALMAQGLSPEEARREARSRFGDLDGTRRYCRLQDEGKEANEHRALMLFDLVEDVRISFRGLLRAPVVAVTVLATVGLGIGATTAIFGAVHAALIRPLPYAEPERLVRIYTDAPPFRFRFSAVDVLALQAQQTSFERTGSYTDRSMTFSDRDVAALVKVRFVSWTYFRLLGIVPEHGRDFSEPDGRPGSPPAVVASRGFWQARLGGRADAIGRPVRLDGADHLLVGVLPPRTGPLERSQELFVAQQLEQPTRKGPFLYTVIARLRPGIEPTVAGEELRAINRRLFPIWKASYQDDHATWALLPLKEHVVGDAGTTAGIALAAVALVWLIACANASNLLVARVTSRRPELAMRAALGASRGRIVRLLFTESALLALGSVGVGSAVARAGVGLLRGAGADYFPRMAEVGLDGPTLWLLGGLALLSVLVFGLVPALHGTGGPAAGRVGLLGRSSTAGVDERRLRQVLVGSQFAVATPLLIVAVLLLISLNGLKNVDLGFDGRRVVTASIRLPSAQYRDPARVRTTWDEIGRRVGSLPGVAGVAFADGRPPNDVGNFNNFDLEDSPAPPGQAQPVTPWVAVTPEYFRVLGLRLTGGRLLDERDAQQPDLESVVVDQAWARRFFPGTTALGTRFREGGCTSCPWTTVVGVVSEVKYAGLDKPDQGTVYWPLAGSLSRYLVVRTTAAPGGMLPAIERVVRELEPGAPLANAATIDELVARSLERPQSISLLVGSFALIALALCLIGIYGVMTYYVQQHLKDISIRVALGGSRGAILRLVVGQGMLIVGLGVAAGLVTAVGATRLASSLLFGVGAAPVAFVAVGALLVLAAFAACLLPATRAFGVPPAALLRQD